MSLLVKIIITACFGLLGVVVLLSSRVFRILRPNRTRPERGLRVRHNPKDAKFEIVAVHGLGADPEYTWTCEAESAGPGGPGRVHTLDLLAKDFQNARILNFAHSSDWLVNASISTVQETGITLSKHLVSYRKEESSSLPIVFIGHSFGGIVIKEALDWLANENPWDSNDKGHAKNIIENTRGILFLGTPHRGSSRALWAYLLAQATCLLGSETGLLFLLIQDSGQLSDIADKFERTRKSLTEAKIFSFYEQKSSYLGYLPISTIVSKESARGPSDNQIAIEADHSGLNKCPGGLSDHVFQNIKDAVESMTSSSPSLLRADRRILERYTNDDRLQIRRISGEELSMDSCYVNLNIVKQESRDGQCVDKIQPPSLQLSLLDRLKIQKFDNADDIRLPDIFNPRDLLDEMNKSQKRRPRRILIRGRPGVGKSTLCKKILHDFKKLKDFERRTKESCDKPRYEHEYAYCDHFARILWLPFRDLVALPPRGDKSYLEWLLQELWGFAEVGADEPMVKALNRHLCSSSADDTLFLLDGKDEIEATLQDRRDLKELVNWLLRQRNVIVTSRPSVVFDRVKHKHEAFDLELETIGFYQDQVRAYVENVAANEAGKILDFLEHRPLIQDLVRIPIQLDALCFAWQEEHNANPQRQSESETMTDLYQAIERTLWKRDAKNYGRVKGSTPLDSEIETEMIEEIKFLERLAFDGLQQNLTVFDNSFIKQWSNRLPKDLIPKRKGLDGTLQSLSFLRSPSLTEHHPIRNYYFIHLTQQEYFAARHLQRQWIAGSAKAIAFFQKHKYSEQFDVVWRFLTGLFRSHDDKIRHVLEFKFDHNESPDLDSHFLDHYFEEIQNEPLDMLGPAHQRLIMRCLREIPRSRHLSVRKTLEEQLEDWLMFGFYILEGSHSQCGDRSLADDIEYPEHIIEQLISTVKDKWRARLLRSLNLRHTKSVTIANLAIGWLKQGRDFELVKESLSVLATFLELPILEPVIQSVVERLGDASPSVRREAVRVVEKMLEIPKLSQLVVDVFIQRLGYHLDTFREAALKVTASPERPSEPLLQRVAHRRRRDDWPIQFSAPQIFISKQDIRPSTNGQDLILWRPNSDSKHLHLSSRPLREISLLQAHLTEDAIEDLDSNDEEVRRHAAIFLEARSSLPENIGIKLTRKFMTADSLDTNILTTYPVSRQNQIVACKILKTQKHLQAVVIDRLVQLVSNGLHSAKRHASIILQEQWELPETALDTLAQSFPIGGPQSQKEISKILQSQSNLPMPMFKVLSRSLQHVNANTQMATLHTLQDLQHNHDLPDETLGHVASLLAASDVCVGEISFRVLRDKQKLPKLILNRSVCELAINILLRSSRHSKWLARVEQLLQHHDPNIHELALKLSEDWELSDMAVIRVAQLLGDGRMGRTIGLILGRRADSLPLAVLEILKRKLEDESLRIRGATLRALVHVRPMPQDLIADIKRRLQDTESRVRLAAVYLVKFRADLHELVPELLERSLKDEDKYIQETAAMMYLSLRSPPESLLTNFLQILERMDHLDKSYALSLLLEKVREAVEPDPPTPLLEFMAHNLGHEDSATTKFLRRVTYSKSQLPNAVLDILWKKLDEGDTEVRKSALQVLRKRDWYEDKLLTMAKRLVVGGFNQPKILRKLGNQSNLPISVLTIISELFREERRRELNGLLLPIILKNPDLATICVSKGVFLGFYRFLLEQSFGEHLVWFHQPNGSDNSSLQSRWCYQTMDPRVEKALIEARKYMRHPDTASEDES